MLPAQEKLKPLSVMICFFLCAHLPMCAQVVPSSVIICNHSGERYWYAWDDATEQAWKTGPGHTMVPPLEPGEFIFFSKKFYTPSKPGRPGPGTLWCLRSSLVSV